MKYYGRTKNVNTDTGLIGKDVDGDTLKVGIKEGSDVNALVTSIFNPEVVELLQEILQEIRITNMHLGIQNGTIIKRDDVVFND